MEERRPKMELLKKDDESTRSGVVNSGVVSSKSLSATNDTGTIAPGAILDGKYLIGTIIGSGAFGLVYEAKNLELDEKVALKTMRPELMVDTAMVARFAREAKSAAAIKSEYVASVYDVGMTTDGAPYIVMEYLDGKNFGQLVEEAGAFNARTAVEYALQICEALAVAHAKGIVHRDIKPENLLLTERAGGMKIVKVLDFGISKAALTGSIFGNELPIVKTLNLMGTPLYMSPEQVRCSDNVDVRSDIWSVGMVLYEILAGTTAFDEGSSITEICAAILETKPKPIELHRNDLPSGLVEVISKCLEKDANRRYQNVAELAMALMPFGPKRSRLNVERAVSVLQGAGQVDPELKVDSIMPPSSQDISGIIMPRLTPPSISLASPTGQLLSPTPPPATSSTMTGAAVSGIPSSAPQQTNRTLRYAAIGAIVLGLIGSGTVVMKKLARDDHASAPPVATNTAAATAAPTPTEKPVEAKPVDPPKADPTTTAAAAAVTPATPTPTPANPNAGWRPGAGAPVGAGLGRPRGGTAPATPAATPVATPAATPAETAPAAAPNPVSATPAAKPTETSKGRTFRRDF